MVAVAGVARTTVTGFQPDQLAGFRIAVTSDRRSADLIDAFVRRGASVLHAPTLTIASAAQDEALIADTAEVIRAAPDVLLATTSYGMRRWFEAADSAGLGTALMGALAGSAVLVRGPKSLGSIRAAGLDDAGMSEQETTASLVDLVLADYPAKLAIVVQLHGYTDERQLDRLRAAGHRVLTVAPYRWARPDHTDDRVARLIDALSARQLDCITFTSAPAVDALFGWAQAHGRYEDVIAAFESQVLTAAVGPVTAAPLRAAGITPIQPERFRMGALIRLVCEKLEQDRVERIQTRHGALTLRGCLVELGGERRILAPNALALFRMLLGARGRVVSRAELARSLPGNPDDHTLEVALSRLRHSLGAPGLVATVVKRGYRLDT
ncbi:MAG TPA: uroporphyrinogen-III synthase [Microbacteriaceae bacterium]